MLPMVKKHTQTNCRWVGRFGVGVRRVILLNKNCVREWLSTRRTICPPCPLPLQDSLTQNVLSAYCGGVVGVLETAVKLK